MKQIEPELKQLLFEQAARRAMEEGQADHQWAEDQESYGEWLDRLEKELGTKAVLDFEGIVNKVGAHSEMFLYWQGILDGIALLKMLKVF